MNSRLGLLAFRRWARLALAVLLSYSALHIPNSALASAPVNALEEGKALFETGRYMDALGKFMMVLRTDPQNPEARQYLRQVVDQMRQNPASAAPAKRGLDGSPSPSAQADMRAMLQKRSALTLDLQAIPGVKLTTQNSVTQVEIETARLFPDNAGGLKEEGIPILDRLSAWLKTFGQQPVIIHCYPEELQDAATTGSLFLRRYSELYNFLVDERKLPAQRFISADLLVDQSKGPSAETIAAVGTQSRIVVETVGAQASYLEGGMPSASPRTAIARWLEFSIYAPKDVFNPEEGEWQTLDIAALSRTGMRDWSFTIAPQEGGKTGVPVVQMSGTSNVLKRFNWDGRNQATGSFVPAGTFVARLSGTASDGSIKNEQIVFRVLRTTVDEVVAPTPAASAPSKAKKSTKTAKKSAKKTEKAAPSATATAPSGPDTKAIADAAGLTAPAPTTPAPAEPAKPATPAVPSKAEAVANDSDEDSSHAIWKQVVQFDAGSAELSASAQASLEKIAKTLEVYPLQKVRIVGFASSDEAGGAAMAKQRAAAVKAALTDQFHVAANHIEMGGSRVKSGQAMSKVELSITN